MRRLKAFGMGFTLYFVTAVLIRLRGEILARKIRSARFYES